MPGDGEAGGVRLSRQAQGRLGSLEWKVRKSQLQETSFVALEGIFELKLEIRCSVQLSYGRDLFNDNRLRKVSPGALIVDDNRDNGRWAPSQRSSTPASSYEEPE